MRRLIAAALVTAAALAGCGSHHATTTVHRAPGPGACAGYVTAYGCQAHSPTFGLPPKSAPKLTAPSSVPTREQFDSVNLSVIPARPAAVAGYLSGNWPTYMLLAHAFPSAVRIPVAIRALPVYPSLVGRMVCLDIEPGDATASEAGAWDRGELRLGVKPCDYANLSTMPQVRASIAAAGVKRSQVFEWDADWTFTPHLDAGYDATQWTDHALGRNLDESTATLAFLGLRPAPKPKPLPVCFTHRMSKSACSSAKTQIARDQAAAASSQRAYRVRGCQVLSQRVSWYSTQLRRHPKTKTASRKRALAASRRAYGERSCGTFAQRDRFFTAKANQARSSS